MQKSHVLEMGKSAIRPLWMHKLEVNILSIAKQEKDLGVVIQDNLSPEKHINGIFGDTLRMAFHFLDKDMMRKIITTMIRPKLEYAEKHCLFPDAPL